MSEGDAERHTHLKPGHRMADPVLLSEGDLKRIFAVPPYWLSKVEISKPRNTILDRLLKLFGVKRN